MNHRKESSIIQWFRCPTKRNRSGGKDHDGIMGQNMIKLTFEICKVDASGDLWIWRSEETYSGWNSQCDHLKWCTLRSCYSQAWSTVTGALRGEGERRLKRSMTQRCSQKRRIESIFTKGKNSRWNVKPKSNIKYYSYCYAMLKTN